MLQRRSHDHACARGIASRFRSSWTERSARSGGRSSSSIWTSARTAGRFWRDLQCVRDTRGLARIASPRRQGVWLQVAGRLRQEGRAAARRQRRRPSPAPCSGCWQLPPALSIAVGASLMLLLRGGDARRAAGNRRTASAPAPGNASGRLPSKSIEDEFRLAEQHYQNAIAKLEEKRPRRDPASDATIDPQTAAMLQKGLTSSTRRLRKAGRRCGPSRRALRRATASSMRSSGRSRCCRTPWC